MYPRTPEFSDIISAASLVASATASSAHDGAHDRSIVAIDNGSEVTSASWLTFLSETAPTGATILALRVLLCLPEGAKTVSERWDRSVTDCCLRTWWPARAEARLPGLSSMSLPS